MVKEEKKGTLAILSMSPEQILKETLVKKTDLEHKLTKLRNPGLLGRYVIWRKKGDSFSPEIAWLDLTFRTIENLVLVLLLFRDWENVVQFYFVLLLILVTHVLVSAAAGSALKSLVCFAIARSVFFPLAPFICILDMCLMLAKTGTLDYQAIIDTEKELRELNSASHVVVPRSYIICLKTAREELLGKQSTLRVDERDLQAKLETVQIGKETLYKRLHDAEQTDTVDAQRVDDLLAAVNRLEGREKDLSAVLSKQQHVITKTAALLDECERYVTTTLPVRLEDDEIIRKFDALAEGERRAIERVELNQDRHVSLLRQRVLELAAIAETPRCELSTNNPDGEMRDRLQRIDDMAGKLAELETKPLPCS